MAVEGFKRKLTAILSADVEGYSRLMGDNEEDTVRTLTSYREVLTTLIQQHNGKVLDSPGDNLLAEFVSVVDAVQCAVAVQKEIKARNDQLPENRRMQFRIGINLGDVIQEDERIYGDGVNIAARLEGLSEPGGICISKTAFDHIESKLPYGYDFIGDQTVKNIAKPVGAYRVLMDPRVTFAGKSVDEKPAALQRMPILVGVVAVLVFAVAVGIWQFYMRRSSVAPASIEKMALPLPDKPSIAVLPFVNVSDDPKQEYFCDGLTEEIITALQVELTEGEQVRAAAKGTNNLEAYLKYLQAMVIMRQFNIESNALAKQLAQEAIALDAEYAMAYIVLSSTLQMDVWLGTSKSPKQSIAKSMELIQKAIELDPTYAEAYGHLGFTFSMIEEHDKAVAKAEQAVALNPNSAYVHMRLGHTLRFAGRHEEAIPEYRKAIRLDPIPPTNYLFGLGMAYCWNGQYEEAIKWCEKAVRQDPDSFLAHLMMTQVYSLSGREEDARVEAAEVLRINPKFSVDKWEKASTVKNKTEKERFIGALREAGLK